MKCLQGALKSSDIISRNLEDHTHTQGYPHGQSFVPAQQRPEKALSAPVTNLESLSEEKVKAKMKS